MSKTNYGLNVYIGKSATVGAIVGSLLLYISAGGYFFTLWEDWTFFESFYFCFITVNCVFFSSSIGIYNALIVS